MAVEEQPPAADTTSPSGSTAMDVDTGSKSKYVLNHALQVKMCLIPGSHLLCPAAKCALSAFYLLPDGCGILRPGTNLF